MTKKKEDTNRTTTSLRKEVSCTACYADLSNENYEDYLYCPFCGRKIVEGDTDD